MRESSVLILGAGLVARPMVRYFLDKGYNVTLASNTPDRADDMIAGHPMGNSKPWEADDETALGEMVTSHDLTVSLLPYAFHVKVAKHCILRGRDMVTTSYVKPEMKALDGDAKRAGILILNEIGLDPGIDHMSAMRIIDHVHRKEGAVIEFYSVCGALPASEAAGNPFRYKFSWSPRGVIMAGNNDAVYLRHGREVRVPTGDLFKNPVRTVFPEVGPLDIYPNRDSLAYKEVYGIPEAMTVFRGTFRFPGWCETLDVMKRLNLISCEPMDLGGLTYGEMTLKAAGCSPPSGHSRAGSQQLAAAHLGIPGNSDALEAIRWLGLFDPSPLPPGYTTTFDVTADRMIEKMGLGKDERDMVVMQHTFLAGYSDGRKEVIRSRMLDFGQPGGDTAIARTVSLPAAIAAEMILERKISLTGVHVPVIPEIYDPVLDKLEGLGIKMVEEFGLPLTENISV